MSQQINLCNPALRKKHEWLTLASLLAVVGLIVCAQAAIVALQSWERSGSQRQQAALQDQLKTLQEAVQAATKAISERKTDPAVAAEIETATRALKEREEALRVLESSGLQATGGYSSYFAAFARQTLEGVWLTGFSIAQDRMAIRGRVLDGGLLPTYIRKLNAEPSFQGRQFSALNMKAVDPVPPPQQSLPSDSVAAKPVVPRPYVEFVLTGVGMPSPAETTPLGQAGLVGGRP